MEDLDSRVHQLEKQIQAARLKNLQPSTRKNLKVFKDFPFERVTQSKLFKKCEHLHQRHSSVPSVAVQTELPLQQTPEPPSYTYQQPVYSLYYNQFEAQLRNFQQYLQTQLEQVRNDLAEEIIDKDIEIRSLKRTADSYKVKNKQLQERCEALEDSLKELQLEVESKQSAEDLARLKCTSAKLRADQDAANYDIERLKRGVAHYRSKAGHLQEEINANEHKLVYFKTLT